MVLFVNSRRFLVCNHVESDWNINSKPVLTWFFLKQKKYLQEVLKNPILPIPKYNTCKHSFNEHAKFLSTKSLSNSYSKWISKFYCFLYTLVDEFHFVTVSLIYQKTLISVDHHSHLFFIGIKLLVSRFTSLAFYNSRCFTIAWILPMPRFIEINFLSIWSFTEYCSYCLVWSFLEIWQAQK